MLQKANTTNVNVGTDLNAHTSFIQTKKQTKSFLFFLFNNF